MVALDDEASFYDRANKWRQDNSQPNSKAKTSVGGDKIICNAADVSSKRDILSSLINLNFYNDDHLLIKENPKHDEASTLARTTAIRNNK